MSQTRNLKGMGMAEYIERSAAVEAAKHAWAKGLEPSQYIEDLPAADVVPVVHARWIYVEETLATSSGWCCSACRRPRWLSPDVPEVFKYCPNCGAKMDGGNENV